MDVTFFIGEDYNALGYNRVMVLMIDNYDSFTYNIVQYCLELGADLKVIRNDDMSVDEIAALKPEKIIISPGPATPDEAGVSLLAIEHFKDDVPILGICLGHQSIAQVFGAKVVRADRMMHGKTSLISHDRSSPIFSKLPEMFTATRYHSLVVEKQSVPDCIHVSALSSDDNEIMALEIVDRPIYGVQFHPESIMSEFGHEILGNFLNL